MSISKKHHIRHTAIHSVCPQVRQTLKLLLLAQYFSYHFILLIRAVLLFYWVLHLVFFIVFINLVYLSIVHFYCLRSNLAMAHEVISIQIRSHLQRRRDGSRQKLLILEYITHTNIYRYTPNHTFIVYLGQPVVFQRKVVAVVWTIL